MNVYHVTELSNLDSILENGLKPMIGDRCQKINLYGIPLIVEPLIYCFPSKEILNDLMQNWLHDQWEPESKLVYLEIKASKQFESDIGHTIAYSLPINPDQIVAIYNDNWTLLVPDNTDVN